MLVVSRTSVLKVRILLCFITSMRRRSPAAAGAEQLTPTLCLLAYSAVGVGRSWQAWAPWPPGTGWEVAARMGSELKINNNLIHVPVKVAQQRMKV